MLSVDGLQLIHERDDVGKLRRHVGDFLGRDCEPRELAKFVNVIGV
jgi:hypothetical protein